MRLHGRRRQAARCRLPEARRPQPRQLVLLRRARHRSWGSTAPAQGGFPSQRDAQAALVDLLNRVQKRTHVDAGRQTVGAYLDDWLAGKARLRASTRRTYAEHIRLYLTPALGHLRLDQLDAVDIERIYTAIRNLGSSTGRAPSPEMKAMLAARQRTQPARPLTAARLRRIHATLMSALNTAVKRRLLPVNPASYVELDTGRRPQGRGLDRAAPGALARHQRASEGRGLAAGADRGVPRPRPAAPATPCCTSSPSGACGAARPSGCGGPRSTSSRRR